MVFTQKLVGPRDHITDTETHEYFLGMYSGLRNDLATLDVHFDAGGRVSKVEVVHH